MLWKKPAEMKQYTDMCKWVDEHMHMLADPECPEDVKNKIYNYLWLIVKALAIKGKMFTSFEDYDGYSFYAANRLYWALKKNLENRGKIIKGKQIKPIKSCLNYMKKLMYPMMLEYRDREYNTKLAAKQAAQKFDTLKAKQNYKNDVWDAQGGSREFRSSVSEFLLNFGDTLEKVLKKAPFRKGTTEYQNLKISILMNVKANLDRGKGLTAEPANVLLWKLPKSMAGYVRIFITELGTAMKQTIISQYEDTQIDDRIIDYMLSHPEGDFIDYENQD